MGDKTRGELAFVNRLRPAFFVKAAYSESPLSFRFFVKAAYSESPLSFRFFVKAAYSESPLSLSHCREGGIL